MSSFDEIWRRDVEPVGKRNRRGAGWSEVGVAAGPAWRELGTARGYVKRQQNYVCRPVWNLGRATPTVSREARFLARAAAAGVTVPAIHFCRVHGDGRALLLVGAIEPASSLRETLRTTTESARAELLDRVGTTLCALHRARIAHGALYDTHVLVRDDGAIALIDFEKARRKLTRSWAAISDLRRFFRRTSALDAEDRCRILSAYPAREFPLLLLWSRLQG
jgi:RIO-like serine/threonine protein kinase